VLVVEDRPSVRKLVAAVLERGCEVRAAASAAEALPLLGVVPLDVVLTDVRMPGASGFDVLRAVRERSPGTVVVLMTAYATVPDAVAAMKLGAYDYVAKPIDGDELALVVARAAEHRREARAAGSDDGEAAPPGVDSVLGFHEAVEVARRRASRRYLEDLMQLFQGNVTHAAIRAGMTRESLHRLLRAHGIAAEEHRRPRGPSSGDSDE
jgi:DNA-binding NtrC family response regulator